MTARAGGVHGRVDSAGVGGLGQMTGMVLRAAP